MFPFILAHCIHSSYEHEELKNPPKDGTIALVVTSRNLDLSKFMSYPVKMEVKIQFLTAALSWVCQAVALKGTAFCEICFDLNRQARYS